MFRKLRNFIDDQNARFAKEKKAAKSKVSEAKEKVRLHKVFCFFWFCIGTTANCHMVFIL